MFLLFILALLVPRNYEEFKIEMTQRVNEIRAKGCNCGGRYMPPVGPVSWNDRIGMAAARHAIDMDRFDYFSHISRDGRDIGDRITATGYRWYYVSENIAWGYRDIDSVLRGWLKSPSHCRNMMNPRLKHMGVAKKGTYWVQDFGTGK